jgi:hypothetical protein
MSQEIINIVDASEIGIMLEDPEKKQQPKVMADFYYANNSLYVVDKKNNRILGFDEDNKIFMEIGETFFEANISVSEKLWEKELNTFLSQFDDPEQAFKKKKMRTSPRQKVRQKYSFKQLDKLISDFDESLYVTNYVEAGMELLKFDAAGNFLYRIGRLGRDNPYFDKNTSIYNMFISKDNGLWIKYMNDGTLSLSFYNNFGKNIFDFNEKQILDTINGFLEKNENEYFRIEDILPLYGKNNHVAVIVNLYRKDGGKYLIKQKMFFKINQEYSVEDYWKFNDTYLQVQSINLNNQLLCFSFYNKEKIPLFKLFNDKGSMILEKKIILQRFNYNRISVDVTQSGDLMGAFLKQNILYFVIWK